MYPGKEMFPNIVGRKDKKPKDSTILFLTSIYIRNTQHPLSIGVNPKRH